MNDLIHSYIPRKRRDLHEVEATKQGNMINILDPSLTINFWCLSAFIRKHRLSKTQSESFGCDSLVRIA